MRVIVKIGGSLLNYSKQLEQVLQVIDNDYENEIIIVPGGGIFADTVKNIQEKLDINDDIAHWMAIKATEIYAIYISEKLSRGVLCENLQEIENYLSRRYIPIVLPFKIMYRLDILPKTWKATSDSIAILIAILTSSDLTILLKVIDGLIINGKLIRQASVHELSSLQGIADDYILELIKKYKIRAVILNALRIENLIKVLRNEEGEYTLITP